jgi:purine-cytosine permease-like protein
VAPRADRRWVALGVGALATTLALVVDLGSYTSFLYLIGAVFVPLFAVAVTDFAVVSRGHWDLGDRAHLRWQPLVAWAAGFSAYQLLNPGSVAGWTDAWTRLHDALPVEPPGWLGASLTSLVVAVVAMLVLGLPTARSARARQLGR